MEYWDVGVRVGDSWMNGCFVLCAFFGWIEVVEWGIDGVVCDCQRRGVKWMDLNLMKRGEY